jgi:GNAT superfamily N-acetyltransferase
MDKTLTLSIENTVSETDRAAVERGLMDVARASGIKADDPQPIAVLLRDPSGTLVAGLIGNLIWNWLNIRLLWVAEHLRGQGHGATILRAAEAEAARRGFPNACLETFNEGALRFYLREGYTTYGTLPDYPKGHTRYCLAKAITAPAPEENRGGDQ